MNSHNHPTKRRTIEMIAVGAFVAINIFAPFVVGELYPFTVSPMFRDQPEQYCTYQLFDDDGNELELEPYGLHLIYDGNPPGLGMGIEAQSTLHEFGEVPDLQTIEKHILNVVRQRDSNPKAIQTIRVCQTVVCCNGTRPEANVREATISLAPPTTE